MNEIQTSFSTSSTETGNSSHSKKPSWFRVGIVGGIVAAICCAAPAIIALLAAAGLGWFGGYFNYVIIASIFALVGFAAYTLWQRNQA
jgi:hypothetical protein